MRLFFYCLSMVLFKIFKKKHQKIIFFCSTIGIFWEENPNKRSKDLSFFVPKKFL